MVMPVCSDGYFYNATYLISISDFSAARSAYDRIASLTWSLLDVAFANVREQYVVCFAEGAASKS